MLILRMFFLLFLLFLSHLAIEVRACCYSLEISVSDVNFQNGSISRIFNRLLDTITDTHTR